VKSSPTTPTIEELRREQRILERQIQSRTGELEKVNESLRDENTELYGVVKELKIRLDEQTDSLRRANECLLAEMSEHGPDKLCNYGQELRALAVRLQRAREDEKAHLAREMHDELSGALTALKLDLSLLPDRAAKDRSLFLEKLRSMSELIDRTLARIQSIATALRPVVLDKLGLVAAIEWQAGEFQDHSGIACESHLPDEDLPLDSDRSTAVFRILQEALTNVARHANATKVVVGLKSEAKDLILTVQDNGKGIDEKAIRAHNSMGLLGMRERALAFGGATEVTAVPAGGTLVSLRVPIA
jgi:signal transduction histidine kinase